MAETPIFSKIYYCFDHENKSPALPFGACILLFFLTGASPLYTPDGLSGLTMKFLYIELGLNRAMQTILVNIHEKKITPYFLIFVTAFVCSKAVVHAEEKGKNTPQKQSRPEKNTSPSQAGSTVVEMNEAEAPADLNRLIQEALEHNPEIIAAQKRVNAAKARIPQAKSLDDPTIRAGSYDMSNSPVNVNGQTEMLQQTLRRIAENTVPRQTASKRAR